VIKRIPQKVASNKWRAHNHVQNNNNPFKLFLKVLNSKKTQTWWSTVKLPKRLDQLNCLIVLL